MSVKGKVKRLNRKLEEMKQKNIQQADRILYLEEHRYDKTPREETLENIVKFALTNQVGGLRAGMMIDAPAIDKMKDVRLIIDRDNECGGAYVIRTHY